MLRLNFASQRESLINDIEVKKANIQHHDIEAEIFERARARSYHWVYPDSDVGLFQKLLTNSKFIIEKIPLSKKFGRFVSIIARKLEWKSNRWKGVGI